MRVLVAHSLDSASALRGLLEAVHSVFRCSALDDVDVVVRAAGDLGEFLFVPGSRWMDRSSITRFERVDVVIVEGRSAPWAVENAEIFNLVSQCVAQRTPLFGGPFAAAMHAYARDTMGRPLPAMRTGPISELEALRPDGSTHFLDPDRGALFEPSFDGRKHTWKLCRRVPIRRRVPSASPAGPVPAPHDGAGPPALYGELAALERRRARPPPRPRAAKATDSPHLGIGRSIGAPLPRGSEAGPPASLFEWVVDEAWERRHGGAPVYVPPGAASPVQQHVAARWEAALLLRCDLRHARALASDVVCPWLLSLADAPTRRARSAASASTSAASSSLGYNSARLASLMQSAVIRGPREQSRPATAASRGQGASSSGASPFESHLPTWGVRTVAGRRRSAVPAAAPPSLAGSGSGGSSGGAGGDDAAFWGWGAGSAWASPRADAVTGSDSEAVRLFGPPAAAAVPHSRPQPGPQGRVQSARPAAATRGPGAAAAVGRAEWSRPSVHGPEQAAPAVAPPAAPARPHTAPVVVSASRRLAAAAGDHGGARAPSHLRWEGPSVPALARLSSQPATAATNSARDSRGASGRTRSVTFRHAVGTEAGSPREARTGRDVRADGDDGVGVWTAAELAHEPGSKAGGLAPAVPSAPQPAASEGHDSGDDSDDGMVVRGVKDEGLLLMVVPARSPAAKRADRAPRGVARTRGAAAIAPHEVVSALQPQAAGGVQAQPFVTSWLLPYQHAVAQQAIAMAGPFPPAPRPEAWRTAVDREAETLVRTARARG